MPALTFAAVDASARAALSQAIADIKADDRFARIVVVADHHDAARAVSHLLGAQDAGLVNVSLQTGRRLASELAGGALSTPPRILEGAAVRAIADNTPQAQDLEPAGRRRFYYSLADAFRSMAERPPADDATDIDATADANPNAMNLMAEDLYRQYRQLLDNQGYAMPAEVARQAAKAVNARNDANRLPNVIYYLPRRMSAGDLALAQALLAKNRCRIIAGLTGNADADDPALQLAHRLDDTAINDATISDAAPAADPLTQRAAAGQLAIIAASDPEEEVRTVIRRIAAADTPWHRIAVIYRQPNPYASLLRQELDFAGIPCAGVIDRSLADTPTGLLLQGIVSLAEDANISGTIDREKLLDLLATTPVRWPNPLTDAGQSRTVPAARWAKLAREAHANGPPANWQTRLNAHHDQVSARLREISGDGTGDAARRLEQDCNELHSFVAGLSDRLVKLNPAAGATWSAASEHLEALLYAYRWFGAGETDDDRRRIAELITSLAALHDWGAAYDLPTLTATIREGLQTPVAERGQPVGAGVYIGPPAGIAGADYDAVYLVGMVERQFPPRPSVNPWLADNPAERRREANLERYDFLASVAAGRQVTLSYPAATAARRAAYPSRWLVDAATALHQTHGGSGRRTYENIHAGEGAHQWLTTIQSRADGLRRLPEHTSTAPADLVDYRLMHLLSDRSQLAAHTDADDRMRRALAARRARNSSVITEWDGKVPADSVRISAIASKARPISPSALETWAGCPYRYFLSRILGLSALPEGDDDEQISALEKGSLVHKILEEFVKQGKQTADELLELADDEFDEAEQRGVTGHYLLWEMAKAEIRDGLTAFLAAEQDWFKGQTPDQSDAEVSFDGISIDVAGLGAVYFRGLIDRLDVIGDQVLVRDFKTGRPDAYFDGSRGRKADRTIANGKAAQLPVYVAAAQQKYPNHSVTASYCFPLADRNTHDIAPYTDSDRAGFDATLTIIINSARSGVFPATSEGNDRGTNCHYCDFNNLCPTRRRQIWQRKGRHDQSVQPFNALGGKAAIGDDDAD